MSATAAKITLSIVVSLLTLAVVPLAAEVIPISSSPTGIELLATEGAPETLAVTVGEVTLDAVEIEGAQWAVVRVPLAHNLMERGFPSLPFLATEYLLGPSDGIALELVEVTVRSIDLAAHGFVGVAPSKGHFTRDIDPATVPWVFDDRVYASDEPYPTADSWVEQPFISGPLRGQALRLPVARWQAESNTLSVVERATYRVLHLAAAPNPRTRPAPAMTGLFDQLARSRAVNYQEGRYTPFVESGRLLILAYDDFVDEAQPLADWETQVGYPTLLVPKSAAGSTAAQIQSYIQTLYNQPEGLTWVILVGDSGQIPSLTGVNEGATCDPCYTKLEGGDNRPDAAISRIAAQSGAEVTNQVNKFLTYERYPDTGSASVWYPSAFGIGGDDYGGGAYDWERIKWLRDDLVPLDVEPTEPHYTYSEFTELYHSVTKTQIQNAVNDGRSLGMYIGHGGETYWVNSGFDTSDVQNLLSNGDMLPIIWDVACVNGRFDRAGGDCFAEAWLKKVAGGAVSFEAGTTNESWVPPCDAQRGIIDSLRLETAFTTGGQHVNGKLYCMDVNGDSNGSEGTKFMEQSTLFGSCVMWPRTVAPAIPDEPDDFAAAGGVASLTVKVGGQPYAKANGAIVSFYTTDGSTLDLLGSGLINSSGVVQAEVSGDPTHCQIHGFNLIPTSFELAARPNGTVSLDAPAYACDGVAGIRVSDSNVPGTSTSTIDSFDVQLDAGGAPIAVTLTEQGADRNVFSGSATLGVDLVVAHGNTLTATYVDADDGEGHTNVTKTDTAAVDCAGPEITNLQVVDVGAITARVVWDTDEPSNSWAQTTPNHATASDTALVTAHSLDLVGLHQCTEYTVRVTSRDALGNLNGEGPTPPFLTQQMTVTLDDDVESGTGQWTVETAVSSPPNWAIVTDAATSSPTHSWFSSDNSAVKDDRLVSGPLALGPGTATLSFEHHFSLESGWDGGVLEISTDGINWADVVVAGGVFLAGGYNGTLTSSDNPIGGRSAWTGGSGGLLHTEVDLSALAGQTVYVRLRIGCDGYQEDQGWWIDDIRVTTTGDCPEPPLFADGFESGDCSAWSAQVGMP